MTTCTDITAEQRLSVVKHLANGRGLAFTATATGLDRDTVRGIGEEHGWPRPEQLANSREVLTRRLDEQARAQITERPDLAVVEAPQNRRPSGQARRETPLPPVPAPPAPPPPPMPPRPKPSKQESEAVEQLLDRGRRSERKRTQNLTQRISTLLTDLRDRLDEEDRRRREREEREAARRAEQEKHEAARQAALEEVHQAEERLRQARAKLRRHKHHAGGNGRARTTRSPSSDSRRPGGRSQAATLQQRRTYIADFHARHGTTSAVVRAWAAANGHECPDRGMLPRRVLDAYERAHPHEEAS